MGTQRLYVSMVGYETKMLYDARGRAVRTVETGRRVRGGGTETFRFRTGGLSSGVYFIRVTGEDFAGTERMVVVR